MFEIFKKLLWINKVIVLLIITLLILTGLQYLVYDQYLDKNLTNIINKNQASIRDSFSRIEEDSIVYKNERDENAVFYFQYLLPSEVATFSQTLKDANVLFGFVRSHFCFSSREAGYKSREEIEDSIRTKINEKCSTKGFTHSQGARDEIKNILKETDNKIVQMNKEVSSIRDSLLYETFDILNTFLFGKLLDVSDYDRKEIFPVAFLMLIVVVILEALAFMTRKK